MKVYLASIRGVDADFFVVHAKTASQESDEPPTIQSTLSASTRRMGVLS